MNRLIIFLCFLISGCASPNYIFQEREPLVKGHVAYSIEYNEDVLNYCDYQIEFVPPKDGKYYIFLAKNYVKSPFNLMSLHCDLSIKAFKNGKFVDIKRVFIFPSKLGDPYKDDLFSQKNN